MNLEQKNDTESLTQNKEIAPASSSQASTFQASTSRNIVLKKQSGDYTEKDGTPSKGKHRDSFLDILRCLAIFFVFYEHAPLLKEGSLLANFSIFWTVNAPAIFFFVSGAVFLHRTDSPKSTGKKFLHAYIRLSLWKAVFLLCFFLTNPPGFQSLTKGNVLLFLFFFGQIPGIDSTHLWFMHAYLSLLLLLPFLQSFHQEMKKYSFTAFGFSISPLCFPLLLFYFGGIFPFSVHYLTGKSGIALSNLSPFGNYAYLYFYFVLGGMLFPLFQNKNGERNALSLRYAVLWGTSLLSIGTLIQALLYKRQTGFYSYQGLYLDGHSYMSSSIILVLAVIFLAYALLLLGKKFFPKNYKPLGKRRLSQIGSGTFAMFTMHPLILSLLLPFFGNKKGLAINFGKAILLFFLCFLLEKMLRKLPVLGKWLC